MPRQPDPELEARILEAADALWRRGGEKALTMRAVAKAARTNTPAVYRRFKDREHLIRGLLLRIVKRIREQFERGETVQGITEAYVDYALKSPNEYMLFYTYSRILSPRGKQRRPRPIRTQGPISRLRSRCWPGSWADRLRIIRRPYWVCGRCCMAHRCCC